MAAGGWNRGIKGAPGGGMTGKKHSEETKAKLKGRKRSPEEIQRQKDGMKGKCHKPFAEPIKTTDLCQYNCGGYANFKFKSGKLCCSTHYNSCPGKRKQFSDRNDHKETAAKSLATRTRLGITKTSRIKAKNTMEINGTYQILREKMQEHWKNNPHQNNTQCPLLPYKTTSLNYQGSYEYNFLANLEKQHGLAWIESNVKRGPSLWYIDNEGTKRLYISDFIIYNTIYEIKSHWTWNKHGTDFILENNNKAKLSECINQGYNVVLVLNGEEISYA